MKMLMIMLALLLGSCGVVQVEDYNHSQPALDLRQFFDGNLKAYGMLQDRSGRMTRRFSATLHGSWQGETGTLVEHFSFDDGEQQDRTWILQHKGNGRFSGTAGDVVGTADGNSGGSVFQWQYSLNVPWRSNTLEVNLNDWLYLVDAQHLLNKTTLTKFGFRVGELTLVIEKI
ncbi:MAG: DUF3833 domain-containing protein [Gammaproteobacteria bacterium]|jgi:hypothetical protein